MLFILPLLFPRKIVESLRNFQPVLALPVEIQNIIFSFSLNEQVKYRYTIQLKSTREHFQYDSHTRRDVDASRISSWSLRFTWSLRSRYHYSVPVRNILLYARMSLETTRAIPLERFNQRTEISPLFPFQRKQHLGKDVLCTLRNDIERFQFHAPNRIKPSGCGMVNRFSFDDHSLFFHREREREILIVMVYRSLPVFGQLPIGWLCINACLSFFFYPRISSHPAYQSGEIV